MLKRVLKRKGFSLIELLIVIAIIGIIATIAIPILLSARQGAVREKAQNSLRSLASAQFAYYASNGVYAATLAELHAPVVYIDATMAGGNIGQGITMAITAGGGQTFTATATSTNPAIVYTVTEDGAITHVP